MRLGLTGFVAALAYNPEFAARGVTLNSLLPGKFDTDRLAGTLASAQTEWPNCPQVSAPPIPKCNTAKELRGPEPPSLHTNQRTRTPCPGAGAQAPVPSAGKSSATAAAAATPTTSLTCAALGVASSVAPPRSGAHSSICLPARASTCFVLLTPASAAYPGKWPITSRGGAPQTGTSACHTKASDPAAMHSPAALSKRPCWPACATAHAPRPVPRAGSAPGDKTGAGKSRAC